MTTSFCGLLKVLYTFYHCVCQEKYQQHLPNSTNSTVTSTVPGIYEKGKEIEPLRIAERRKKKSIRTETKKKTKQEEEKEEAE